jgi:hypothetical protein
MKDEYVEIKDIDNIKRALENAEIEFEEFEFKDGAGPYTLLNTDRVQFVFNDEGTMTYLEPINE